jgi:hypothetical protein
MTRHDAENAKSHSASLLPGLRIRHSCGKLSDHTARLLRGMRHTYRLR